MDHTGKEQKKNHPRETANVFSKLTFAYTGSLFKKAYKQDLDDEDLYEVLKQCGSKRCGDKMEREWKMGRKNGESSSIGKLLWKRFGWRYLTMGFTDLTWRIIRSISEPAAMSGLISYFRPGQTDVTRNDAFFYAGLMLFLLIFNCLFAHNYSLWIQQLGVEIKTAFSSILYRKALRLTPTAVADITMGNIVTLITKDVHTFKESIWIINDVWIGCVVTCVVCYLIYSKVGLCSFVGIGIILTGLPLQCYIAKWISTLRLQTGKKTDERLQVTQETLSTIRIIKMYTWEKYFETKIHKSRKGEVNKMLLGFYLRTILLLIGHLFTKAGFYILILAYVWIGFSSDTTVVFYLLANFGELRRNLASSIPWCMGKAGELVSAVVRINKVINAEEMNPNPISDEPEANPVLDLKNATVYIGEKEVLSEISFRVEPSLTLVTGTIGSGKSSLLKTMLQDYPLTDGSLVSRGRISYSSQDPWLFPSSIRQNIIFNNKFDEVRYREVIKVCALEYDLNLFDKGDETILTDRGLNLSKGQQARVNLARAIYKESEIYLLDDCLTALDSQVQDYIFQECIKTYLKDKIVILVSQTANHIQEADTVIIMDKGRIKDIGKPSEKILAEVKEFVEDDDDLEKEVIEQVEANEVDETAKLLETEQITSKKKIYKEVKKKGEVDVQVYLKYIAFAGGFMLMFFNIFLVVATQSAESYSDKLLTQWVDEQQIFLNLRSRTASYGTMTEQSNNTFQTMEEISLQEADNKQHSTFIIYSIVLIAAAGIGMIKSYANFDFSRRASINIHKAMVRNITQAVMAFFDTHFIGNVLNRFSQDLVNIDEHLPFVLTECFRVVFSIIGHLILVITVKPSFLIYIFVIGILVLFIRKLYLPAGRSLKRLEAATRSPMVGHLNASLEGLTTIRAYRAQDILIDEFDRHQDLYTSAFYTSICSMRAFAFVVESVSAVFVIMIVATFVLMKNDTSAGDVGLALTQVFALAASIQWGVRPWSDLENLMTSTERLMEYTEIKSEREGGVELKDWPSEGSVVYEHVSLTYNNTETVLRDLNFTVEPRQKIGIVGRTGAGKSSIISTFFRLYEVEGRILIDGVDVKTLSLKYLRRKLAIIPQDPVLFTGTVRSNLDPFGDFSDQQLWTALGRVNLKGSIPSLDHPTSSSGSDLSSGQKQLLCLARAILRKSKIVILDEATANMDHETDILLHSAIKENFGECTIFSIAHRLHSILECDRVMVLDKGVIVEFDDPSKLLENDNGFFYKMVRQAGMLNYLN
uniref:Putative ABCC protein n=1 Tax=Chrysomela populi TaxID=154003 RepID=A0A0U9HSE1_CHRPP